MKRGFLILAAVFSLALTSCVSSTTAPEQAPPAPGHGALAIAIVPNPIVATRVSGSTYDFPFDVHVSNSGSLPVTIDRIDMDVTALGGVRIYSKSMTATDIRQYGYPTAVPAGQSLSYHFAPREQVPDERLFSGVSALLTASGADSSGQHVSASTSVSVTR
ncbi:MAG: hypothetical protein WBX15_13575 [Thermoanaerobaculia bacterium]